jgi:hypothetical protein
MYRELDGPLWSEDVSKEVGERSITEEEEDWKRRYDALFSPSKTYAKL